MSQIADINDIGVWGTSHSLEVFSFKHVDFATKSIQSFKDLLILVP